MEEITINVSNVTKSYKLYEKPFDRVKESFMGKKSFHKDFLAVNDVSFQVKKGETVGIIGGNGAGKSTLLKMITGVLNPSEGKIELSGNVSALLELGTGFDAERNGIENIYLNGRINGLSKKEIEDSIDEILEFADIGDFVYQPIKTYSSGMLVRLAFATAVNIKPEILIVDEALSVGDVRFQQKCYRKIREFKENGTVLLVSHDTGAITSFCDRVIWMDKGKIYKEGTPDEIIEEYLAYMRYEVKSESNIELNFDDSEENISEEVGDSVYVYKSSNKNLEFGNGAAVFRKIAILKENGDIARQVSSGENIKIRMEIETAKEIEFPILGFNVKDDLGNELIVSNTVFEKIPMKIMKAGKKYVYQWSMKFPELHPGSYPMDIALADGTYQNHEQVHFITDAVIIKCTDDRNYQEGRGRLIPRGIKLEEV